MNEFKEWQRLHSSKRNQDNAIDFDFRERVSILGNWLCPNGYYRQVSDIRPCAETRSFAVNVTAGSGYIGGQDKTPQFQKALDETIKDLGRNLFGQDQLFKVSLFKLDFPKYEPGVDKCPEYTYRFTIEGKYPLVNIVEDPDRTEVLKITKRDVDFSKVAKEIRSYVDNKMKQKMGDIRILVTSSSELGQEPDQDIINRINMAMSAALSVDRPSL